MYLVFKRSTCNKNEFKILLKKRTLNSAERLEVLNDENF